MASATWSKPSSIASSSVTVPPKRTPPYIAKSARRREQPHQLEEVLVPAHRDAVPATPPNPAMTRSSSDSYSVRTSRIGSNATRAPSCGDPGELLGERLDSQPVDAGDGMTVVHEVMREGEPRRAHPATSTFAAGRRQRRGRRS